MGLCGPVVGCVLMWVVRGMKSCSELRWAVLGCYGLFWVVIGCSGLFWAVLVMFWVVLDYGKA